jgi:hypothetical protein
MRGCRVTKGLPGGAAGERRVRLGVEVAAVVAPAVMNGIFVARSVSPDSAARTVAIRSVARSGREAGTFARPAPRTLSSSAGSLRRELPDGVASSAITAKRRPRAP